MTLIAGAVDICGQDVFYRSEHGKFPARVIRGENYGRADLVVFGHPSLNKRKKPAGSDKDPKEEPAEEIVILGSQYVPNVRFGQKPDGPGERLLPYWDIN